MFNFYRQLSKLNENAVCVSIISGTGIGAKAIWNKGQFIYRQGDGVIFEKFAPLLEQVQKNQIITLDDSRAFCEVIAKENHLVICGAGHISIPLIKMGKMLDFKVTVIEDRASFANNARRAEADKVLCQPFGDALDTINGGFSDFFVIVTRGHRYDQLCLGKIINKKNAYIGMIGSRLRVKTVMESLAEQGIKRELLEKVYSPIGLRIGAQTPSEIAVAIMAEIIQVKSESKNSFGYPEDILTPIISPELKDVPKSLVTIISRKGSAPRDAGTKMLVALDGSCFGTIGGGCVESEICGVAKQIATDKTPKLMKINLSPENAEEEGMVCGGIIEVYIDPIIDEHCPE